MRLIVYKLYVNSNKNNYKNDVCMTVSQKFDQAMVPTVLSRILGNQNVGM